MGTARAAYDWYISCSLLVPTREAFASALFGVIRNKNVIDSPAEQEGRYTYSNEILPISRFNSASDHTYSEAFYLQDLEEMVLKYMRIVRAINGEKGQEEVPRLI